MPNIAELKAFLSNLKGWKRDLDKEKPKTGQIHKGVLLLRGEELSEKWFETIKNDLMLCGFSIEELKKYDDSFEHLLKISSSKGNLKSIFLKELRIIIRSFSDDIILRLQTRKPTSSPLSNTYDSLLQDVTNQEQNRYLKEAIDCAKHEFLKAAIVLGWCACIDHIQKKIEKNGFANFNITSARIASIQTGRFKRFNKIFNVSTLDDLKEIFDNDILWVTEGMGLIDPNQHTRLKSCFDMRNHSAHPGEAPITPYNVMSFFSDLNEIIFKNTKFS